MTREEITALAEPSTFQPFTIVTGSGQRFRVPHADFIDIPPIPEDEDQPIPPSFVTGVRKGGNPSFSRTREHQCG